MTTKTFKEMQRFDQWWIRLLLLIVLLIPFVPMGMNWTKNGFGYRPIWIEFGFISLTILVVFLFYSLKLQTTIDAKGIHYRFFPLLFSTRTIFWHDISKCYVRTYSPLKEYGGWGIRLGINGKAYNVKGNKGLQLVLKSDKKILFGTQKEIEVENVIQSYFKN